MEWQREGGRRTRERVGQEVKAYIHLTGEVCTSINHCF